MGITQIPPAPEKTYWSAVKQTALPIDQDGEPRFVAKAGPTWFWSSANLSSIATSPDGITWTARSPGGSQTWYSVATNTTASIYVLGASNATLRTSTDLSTWTLRTSNMGASAEITDIIWDGAKFVAVGGRSSTSETKIITSTDGITWTARLTTAAQFNQVAYDGVGNYAAVGAGTTTGSRGIWTSTNGTSWTANTDASGNEFVGIVWNGTNFILLDETGAIWILTTGGGLSGWGSGPQFGGLTQITDIGKLWYDGQFYYTASNVGVIQYNSSGRWQLNYTGFNETTNFPGQLAYAGGQFLGAQREGQLYFGTGPRAQ